MSDSAAEHPPFPPSDQPGDLGRLGPYRVRRRLGAGGMGAVYLAFDSGLRRKAAVKVMLPRFAADPTARERFVREARAAARIKSDHVVTIYAVGEEAGIPYIGMEYLTGYPLDEFLRTHGRLTVPQALRVGREAAEGLAAAHALGMVHRDIKPANLWLEAPNGRVKILDFGLVKPAADGAQLSSPGALLGTPHYMPLEQAAGRPVDHRADLFALGAVLYRLTTGRFAFDGPDPTAVIAALVVGNPPPVRSHNPDLPDPLADLIHRLLAKEPADRPASAREVADTLARFERSLAAGERSLTDPVPLAAAPGDPPAYVPIPVTAYQPTGFEDLVSGPPTPRSARPRSAGLLWGAVAVAVVAAAAAGGAVLSHLQGRRAAETSPDTGVRPTARPPVPTKKPPGGPLDPKWADAVAAMEPEEQAVALVEELKRRNPGFDPAVSVEVLPHRMYSLAFNADGVTDLAPLRAATGLGGVQLRGTPGRCELADLSPLAAATGLRTLVVTDARVSDLAPVKGLPLTWVNVHGCPVASLEPLRGAKLSHLFVAATRVTDLGPVAGMPLLSLGCAKTAVADLSPLKGAQLLELSVSETAVSDLSPLAGMKLEVFHAARTPVADFSVIRDMPLKRLHPDFDPWRDTELLKAIPTLERVNDLPVAEFWAKADADRVAFEAWCASVAKLAPDARREAFVREMRRRNPAFDGEVKATVESGEVTGLEFSADGVTDLAPVRAFPQLGRLVARGTPGNGGVTGLWALAGLPLQDLSVTYCRVADLAPLKGMPLAWLNLYGNPVHDLAPLAGMKLHSLHVDKSAVADLAPLAGMKLVALGCADTRVADLSPLAGMPLERFDCSGTRVASLAPLKGAPLTVLIVDRSGVTDLAPVAGARLQILRAASPAGTDAELAKAFPTLESVNGKPAAGLRK